MYRPSFHTRIGTVEMAPVNARMFFLSDDYFGVTVACLYSQQQRCNIGLFGFWVGNMVSQKFMKLSPTQVSKFHRNFISISQVFV